MNKKSAILIFSVLFLVGVIFYAWAANRWDMTVTITSDETYGESYGAYSVTDWLKGGGNDTVNFTVTMSENLDDTNNVTFVTVEFDEAIGALHNWGNNTESLATAKVVSGSGSDTTSLIETWNCNATGEDDVAFSYANPVVTNYMANWSCYNVSAASQLGLSDKLIFAINLSVNSTGDEQKGILNYTFLVRSGNASEINTTRFDADSSGALYIDDQSPRLIEVNISDGNTTYANSTWDKLYYLNGPITIESLIEDSQLNIASGAVVLGYLCNSTNATITSEQAAGGGGATEQVMTIADADTVGTINHRVKATTSSVINCYTSYTAGVFNNDLGINYANETFNFVFLANDTLNHRILLNSTTTPGQLDSFSITLDDGELLPTIERVNVTQTALGTSDGGTITKTLDDHNGGELDGTNDYLATSIVTFNVELKGGDKPEQVYIVWNDTGVNTTTFGPAVIGGSGLVFPYMTNLDENSALALYNITYTSKHEFSNVSENATTVIYKQTLDLSANNSHDFVFYVYANNTGNNYTRIAGPYRFQVDGGAPSITMTPPTDLVINPRASITYSCKATDGESGAYQIMWKLKKPNEVVYTKKQGYVNVGTDGSDSITFTGDDTNLAGEYNVQCLAIDTIGNEGYHTSSSSEIFSVHWSTGEGGAGEGAAAADIDLSTSEEITITEKQGVISTFTLDGTTVHTIKIKTVDEIAGTVTLIIESDPIEITLKIGETKEVDIDADGANDISITLNKIVNGAADLTTKRLTPLPTEKPTEEVPPTEKPAEEIPTAPEAASKTWLWILIIVIIVVIGVGYWFMKRK